MTYAELVAGIRSGEDDAVRALIGALGAEALCYARELSCGDKTRAREAVTRAFAETIRHIRRYPDEELDRSKIKKLIYDNIVVAAPATPPAVEESVPRAVRLARYVPKEESRFGLNSTFAIIMLSLCVITALWFIIGVMMSMGWFPRVDLGYGWFNKTLFEVF